MDVELWQAFGGRSEYLNAPFDVAQRVRLMLQAKLKVQAENLRETDEDVG